jgi:hypothetical protein
MRNIANAHGTPANASNQFLIAPIDARTWIVAHSRKVIPGAVLRTKQAALDYVFAIARAGALSRVSIKIGSRMPIPRR